MNEAASSLIEASDVIRSDVMTPMSSKAYKERGNLRLDVMV